MQHNGYVTINIASYDDWRNAVLGNGYDADGFYGDQCWDLASEFWYNAGFGTGMPSTAGTGNAYDIWYDRVVNAGDKFDLIYNVQDIKRGDIIVYNYFTGNPYGHVSFADCDYSATGWIYPELPCLSQNNQGTPYWAGGKFVDVHGYDISLFLGAFRFKAWHTTPPVPSTQDKRFKWVLYANRFRNGSR